MYPGPGAAGRALSEADGHQWDSMRAGVHILPRTGRLWDRHSSSLRKDGCHFDPDPDPDWGNQLQ